jgi:hypothetical protein
MSTAAPICPYCSIPAMKTDGVEIYPHRPDLAAKMFWKCERCGAYCGCHGNTDRPLGVPANAQLRRARMILHERLLDPLWMEADRNPIYTPESNNARRMIRAKARSRVYRYLAQQLGIDRKNCHTGMFDLARCRAAWTALNGVTYPQIRDWDKAQKEAA